MVIITTLHRSHLHIMYLLLYFILFFYYLLQLLIYYIIIRHWYILSYTLLHI